MLILLATATLSQGTPGFTGFIHSLELHGRLFCPSFSVL